MLRSNGTVLKLYSSFSGPFSPNGRRLPETFTILALWALDQDLSIETFRKMTVPVPAVLSDLNSLTYLAASRPTEGLNQLWINKSQSFCGPTGASRFRVPCDAKKPFISL